jgi:hypothetical protein
MSISRKGKQNMASNPREFFQKFPIEPHHEVKETYADFLGLTSFDGSSLRIELLVARMEDPKPPAQPTGQRHIVARLVLSPACAMDLINQMNQIAAQLVQAGLIKMEQGQAKPQQKPN